MQSAGCRTGREHSLQGAGGALAEGGRFDKFIPEPMRWFGRDSHEMALQLLIRGRYRYYLTDGALYPEAPFPRLVQVFCAGFRPTPSSPIPRKEPGSCTELWDPGMRTLIRQGKLAEIYRQNKALRLLPGLFSGEQVVRADKPQPWLSGLMPSSGPSCPANSLWL